MPEWFEVSNTDEVLSPGLLFYHQRIQQNIDQMVKIAGFPGRLRPHVKTYKCREVVELQKAAGIEKFKCATLKEAEMLGDCKVRDVLVAYPLVGPSQKQFAELSRRFPQTRFAVLVDHIDQLQQWKKNTTEKIDVFIDIDVGMHRTGAQVHDCHALIDQMDQNFVFRGFHVYDGHIKESDLSAREKHVADDFNDVARIWEEYQSPELELVCGGSDTFPIHALFSERTLSPGTTILWDRGYATQFPDLPFISAATLLCRVVSKPGSDLFCLDLGYKAVASEMKGSPVYFPQLPNAEIVTHSEEHLVLRDDSGKSMKIGDVLYGIPWHICPTVALYDRASVVEEGKVKDPWNIVARERLHSM